MAGRRWATARELTYCQGVADDPSSEGVRRAEGMRAAMADYVRTVHRAYLSAVAGQPPGIRGRLPLLRGEVTVLAAGARNLHVLATTDPMPAPVAPEVVLDDTVDDLRWRLRFYDPVVLPVLGLIEESSGPDFGQVRRVLGVDSVIYHLVVRPGSQVDLHQAGHAGAGLAMDHLAAVRDFEEIRSRAYRAESLVDEMASATSAGLLQAPALLALEIARRVVPSDHDVEAQVREGGLTGDPVALRRTLLAALRDQDSSLTSSGSMPAREARHG